MVVISNPGAQVFGISPEGSYKIRISCREMDEHSWYEKANWINDLCLASVHWLLRRSRCGPEIQIKSYGKYSIDGHFRENPFNGAIQLVLELRQSVHRSGEKSSEARRFYNAI